jgi:hypothetical protein
MKKEVRCIQMWCHFTKTKNKVATTKLENRRKDGDKCEATAYQHWCIDNQQEQLMMRV